MASIIKFDEFDCIDGFFEVYTELEEYYRECFSQLFELRKQFENSLKTKNFSLYEEFLEKYIKLFNESFACKKKYEEKSLGNVERGNVWTLIPNTDRKSLRRFFNKILIPLYELSINNALVEEIRDFIINIALKELEKCYNIGKKTLMYNISFLLSDLYPIMDEYVCKTLGLKYDCKKYSNDIASVDFFESYFGLHGNIPNYNTVRKLAKKLNERDLFKLSILMRVYSDVYCKNIKRLIILGLCRSVRNYRRILIKHGQLIFYGPVGTGKTFTAYNLARCISGNDERVKYITFHSNYEYEDFTEGLFPTVDRGNIKYIVRDGIFKEVALRATIEALKWICNDSSNIPEGMKELCSNKLVLDLLEQEFFVRVGKERLEIINKIMDCEKWKDYSEWDSLPKFVLVIDEINRADLSRVFGELITLLEMDKRLGNENCVTVELPYSREKFGVPPNLYIIGTMNTTDRSIALIDLAVRRRFAFEEMDPNPDLLDKIVVRGINIKDLLNNLNNKIIEKKGKDFQIGHAFFIKLKDENLNDEEKERMLLYTWNHQIAPLLEEIFYGREDELKEIVGKELYDGSSRRVIRIKKVDDLKSLAQAKP